MPDAAVPPQRAEPSAAAAIQQILLSLPGIGTLLLFQRRVRCQEKLQAEELGASRVAVFVQPVRQDQPWRVVVRSEAGGVEKGEQLRVVKRGRTWHPRIRARARR